MWHSDQPISNIATGKIATEVMSKNTLSLKERGHQAMSEFIKRFTLPEDTTTGKSYYAPIKKQAVKLVKEGIRWSICIEENKSRANQKSLFRNHLELLLPIPPTTTPLHGIRVSVVDAMRVVRLIPVSDLKSRTFKYWTINVLDHLNLLPSPEILVVFDECQYAYETPSKNRDTSEWERMVSDLDQELPDTKEWSSFLSNEKNKHQLVNLLVHFILESDIIEKTIFVKKGNQCYYKRMNDKPVIFEDLCSLHKESDQKLPMHAVHASQLHKRPICVTDDTDVFILLLLVAQHFENTVFFRQGKNSDTDGITYHNNNSVSDYIGAEMCEILSCFHVLTGSDYTNPFFRRTKVQSFKRMVAVPSSVSLLSSMSKNVDIPAVIKFILQIIYNRPKTEKTPGETRYRMLFKKRETRGNFCLLNPVLQIKVLSK